MSYQSRIKNHTNPAAIKLLEIMDRKQTNLCVAVDVTTKKELLELANVLGPYICCLKTHIDIVLDFDQDLAQKLQELAKQHDYVIFEDRKFADIGNTVKHQYKDGIFKIASWSDFINCHPLPGEGIVKGLKEVGLPLGRGCILLAEMSSKDNLITPEYTKQSVEMALRNTDFCFGFVGQQRIKQLDGKPVEQDFIYMTPGVGLDAKGDSLGQQYRTPHQVIVESECDVIIVGRGIYGSDNIIENAKRYRKAGWDAYLARLH